MQCSTLSHPGLFGATGKTLTTAFLWASSLPPFDDYSPLISALKQIQLFDAFPQYLLPLPFKTCLKNRQVPTIPWEIKSSSV